MTAADVIAKCIEHDYNRTFYDTALCVLADLKAAGHAVVELPKQTIVPTGWGEECLGAWPGPAGEDPVSAWPGTGARAVATHSDEWLSVEDARSLAAALLAAADRAEAGS